MCGSFREEGLGVSPRTAVRRMRLCRPGEEMPLRVCSVSGTKSIIRSGTAFTAFGSHEPEAFFDGEVITMFRTLRNDIRRVKESDPAARSAFEIWLCYPGLSAVRSHRRAHWLFNHGFKTLARIWSQGNRARTGIEIHPGAVIGDGLFIDHGAGVVIGETTVIGRNCVIYQGATLGGTGKETGKRHPTLGDNVMVGCGARVLGPINIGNNVKIAANAVVLKDLPDNCTAVGVPARVVRQDGVKVTQDLDQIHIPDPVAQELARLSARLDILERKEP